MKVVLAEMDGTGRTRITLEFAPGELHGVGGPDMFGLLFRQSLVPVLQNIVDSMRAEASRELKAQEADKK